MSFLPRTILLATDGSEDSALATRAAVDLSNETGAELHVTHAWNIVPSPHFEGWINEAREEESRELLEEQAESMRASGANPEAILVEDKPARAILGLADELNADLIVMGSRGTGPLQRLATGSVSEGVVHRARIPVLMLRGGEHAWPPGHVVVGDDGSETAKRAAETAAGIAGIAGAGITLVRVYPKLPEVYEEGRKMDPRATDDALRQAQQELGERAGELEATFGSRPKISIAVGDEAAELVEAAHRRDGDGVLTAVGSRGLGTLDRFRMGSVSTKVLRAAEGPVLIHPLEA
ncbi:MAG: universal stress protein [Rubrobacteraceae bacterium]